MTEKIYVISCSQDLAGMGIDRMRKSVEGLEEAEIALDWSRVRIVPVIAAEKTAFQENETHIVQIKPIKIPAYAIVFQSFYGVNGMGHLFCIGALTFKRYDEEREAHVAMFQSRIRASVLPGDLLGQVLIVPAKRT